MSSSLERDEESGELSSTGSFGEENFNRFFPEEQAINYVAEMLMSEGEEEREERRERERGGEREWGLGGEREERERGSEERESGESDERESRSSEEMEAMRMERIERGEKREGRESGERESGERVPLVRKISGEGNINTRQREYSTTKSKSKKSKKKKKREPFTPSNADMRLRMRYYYKLTEKASTEDRNYFIVPGHVIPFTNKTSDGILIFNIWTTMMGSSLLALPWGIQNCGWVLGLCLIFLWGSMCCYTCLLIVRHGKGQVDFCFICYDLLGSWAKYLVWAASIGLLTGSLIAYSVLMAEILFAVVDGFHTFIDPDWLDEMSMGDYPEAVHGTMVWNQKYASLIVFVCIFILSNLNSFDIFVKINTFGVVSVIYTLVFTVFWSFWEKGAHPLELPYVNTGFFVTAGMLNVSFFIHSIILPLLSTAKNPQNNERNVIVGFFLVGMCYTIVGIAGYFAYGTEPEYQPPNYLPQLILDVFELDNIPAFIARILFFCQLFAVYPLVLLLVRVQFFTMVKFESKIPMKFWIGLLNFVIISIGSLFGAFYPNYGRVLSVTGGLCGLVLSFIMPVSVHLLNLKKDRSESKLSKERFYSECFFHGIILLLGFSAAVGQFFT